MYLGSKPCVLYVWKICESLVNLNTNKVNNNTYNIFIHTNEFIHIRLNKKNCVNLNNKKVTNNTYNIFIQTNEFIRSELTKKFGNSFSVCGPLIEKHIEWTLWDSVGSHPRLASLEFFKHWFK